MCFDSDSISGVKGEVITVLSTFEKSCFKLQKFNSNYKVINSDGDSDWPGRCENPYHTDRDSCEGNGGTWTSTFIVGVMGAADCGEPVFFISIT